MFPRWLSNLSLTTLSAWVALLMMVRYFCALATKVPVSLSEGVLFHFSPNWVLSLTSTPGQVTHSILLC